NELLLLGDHLLQRTVERGDRDLDAIAVVERAGLIAGPALKVPCERPAQTPGVRLADVQDLAALEIANDVRAVSLVQLAHPWRVLERVVLIDDRSVLELGSARAHDEPSGVEGAGGGVGDGSGESGGGASGCG